MVRILSFNRSPDLFHFFRCGSQKVSGQFTNKRFIAIDPRQEVVTIKYSGRDRLPYPNLFRQEHAFSGMGKLALDHNELVTKRFSGRDKLILWWVVGTVALLVWGVIEKGWYFEAAVGFLASGVAFLYLYRMIHSIFLGQMKDEHRAVKEAPFWLILPQLVLLVAVIAFSIFPRLILDPIMAVVGAQYPEASLAFDGQTLTSGFGYWNGLLTIVVVVVVFVLTFVWMLVNLRKPRLVKQFNIVFSAERPFRPETTHFAFDFFAPYRRALGFLVRGRSEKAWTAVAGLATSVAGAIRRLYTGNGQTYALHVVLYVGILYLFLGVR